MNFNGGYPEPNLFEYDNEAQGIFNDLISFTNPDLNMSMIYEYSKEELPERIVPFGRDPFGNFLCFDYRSMQENPTIVFYDHESEVEEEKIIYVCDTFTQLLSELYSQ